MLKDHEDMIIRMKTVGVSQKEAYEFFDSLEPASSKFMMGKWKESECRTGHLMDGMLTIAPWHGKEFISPDKVHPLVFEDNNGTLFCVNPKKVFGVVNNKKIMNMISKFAGKVISGEKNFNPHRLDGVLKRFKTTYPYARIREIKFRGTVTSAMIYDELAIIDVFKKLDDNTVFGVMDFKGEYGKKGYFFMLERE